MRKLILIASLWLSPALLQAQVTDHYRIEGENIVLTLHRNMPREEQERLLEISGLKGLSLDSLWAYNSLGKWHKEGWKLYVKGKSEYKLYKSVKELSGDVKWSKDGVVLSDLRDVVDNQTRAVFGYNAPGLRTVLPLKTGKTRFYLPSNLSAKDVYLAGTFNMWSTLQTRMTRTDSGWVADLPLSPGKHCYKYVIDGRWMHDRGNPNRDDDLYGGYNSVYYVTNHVFEVKGLDGARTVVLSGSFNNWDERTIRMSKTPRGWQLPVYLQDGTYAYKFIVDGKWMTDPANPTTRDDGKGHLNSFISIGSGVTFELPGYAQAKSVYVAGTFNNWNREELAMKKTATGWSLSYVLGPGNYQYKFIVDGMWLADPANPIRATEGGQLNSLLTVKPNQQFFLSGYKDAREVLIAGNFSYWLPYSMKKVDNGWVIDLYLPPGKCLYKFIVDGKWILDPSNSLWEENRFHTGNSLLWKDQQK